MSKSKVKVLVLLNILASDRSVNYVFTSSNLTPVPDPVLCVDLTPQIINNKNLLGPLVNPGWRYETRVIRGWSVLVQRELLTQEHYGLSERGLELIDKQLEEIERRVPAMAVLLLKKVKLWLSSPYKNATGAGVYYSGADSLIKNGRNPAMVKGIEFSDVASLDEMVKTMPFLVLHELAHAYHDQVLNFNQPDILACYDKAVANKSYDKVSSKYDLADGGRAYAMKNHIEYFAELTEAFFGQNDYFPFNAKDMAAHDPEMFAVLKKVWGVE
jgi:hypothetical protein